MPNTDRFYIKSVKINEQLVTFKLSDRQKKDHIDISHLVQNGSNTVNVNVNFDDNKFKHVIVYFFNQIRDRFYLFLNNSK